MNRFDVNDLKNVIARAAAAMTDLEGPLNEADKALGDGDTGTMLARLVRALDKVDIEDGSVSEFLKALAAAASETTGSSLGTLTSGALLAMSVQAKSYTGPVPASETAPLLHAAEMTMLQLGRAKLGDKTIIDSLNAVRVMISGLERWQDIRLAWIAAAEKVITNFKGRPCRVGRARMWPDKSLDCDDPGMLAFLLLSQAVGRPSIESL